jgi:uncharacterized membrane protein (UPF0127 family)
MAINITVCKKTSFFAKTKGLIGEKKPQAIYFETRWGIHTFGLQFPIDVLIMNEQNKVVKLKENLKPNRIFLWNPRYKSVLELPAAMIKQKRIKHNTTLIFP